MKGNLIWEKVIKVVTLENLLRWYKEFCKKHQNFKIVSLSGPIKAVPKYA